MTPFRKLILFFAGLFALSYGCMRSFEQRLQSPSPEITPSSGSRTTDPSKAQGTYDVWEYTILSAQNVSGRKLTIEVVDDSRFDRHNPLFGTEQSPRPNGKIMPVGSSQQFDTPSLSLATIGQKFPEEIKSIKLMGSVIAVAKHIASCPVEIEDVVETSIVNTNPGGSLIAVPTIKRKTVRKFSEPSCRGQTKFGWSDSEVAKSTVVADARAQDAHEQRVKERAQTVNDRARELMNAYHAKAKEAASRYMQAVTPFEKELCPDVPAKLSALGLSALKIENVYGTEKKNDDGSTSRSFIPTATLVHVKGPPTERNLNDTKLANTFRKLSLDSSSCLKVEVGDSPTGDLSTPARNLKKYLDVWAEHIYGEQAEAEVPPVQ